MYSSHNDCNESSEFTEFREVIQRTEECVCKRVMVPIPYSEKVTISNKAESA